MALLKTVKTASLMPFCTGMQEGFFYRHITGNISFTQVISHILYVSIRQQSARSLYTKPEKLTAKQEYAILF